MEKKTFPQIVSCEVFLFSEALRAAAIIEPLTRVYDIISSTNLHKTFGRRSWFRFFCPTQEYCLLARSSVVFQQRPLSVNFSKHS